MKKKQRTLSIKKKLNKSIKILIFFNYCFILFKEKLILPE